MKHIRMDVLFYCLPSVFTEECKDCENTKWLYRNKQECLISYGQRLYLLIWSGNLSTEVKKYDFISKYSDFRQSGHEYEVTVSMDWQ